MRVATASGGPPAHVSAAVVTTSATTLQPHSKAFTTELLSIAGVVATVTGSSGASTADKAAYPIQTTWTSRQPALPQSQAQAAAVAAAESSAAAAVTCHPRTESK